MITRQQVFTRVATAFATAFTGGKAYEGRNRTPSSMPALWCVEADTYRLKNNVTFDMKDQQRRSVFEVQSFSNLSSGATKQAHDIILLCESVFNEMGYRMTTCSPLDNQDDASIKREVARFERVIGGGDTI